MPLAVLRKWADDVATGTSSRQAARRFRMSVEGLRQFIRADTRPQDRTLRKLGEAYLAAQREARAREEPAKRPRRVAETRARYEPAALEQDLRAALPPTRDDAARLITEVFAPWQNEPDAKALQAALLRWIAEQLPSSDGTKPDSGNE